MVYLERDEYERVKREAGRQSVSSWVHERIVGAEADTDVSGVGGGLSDSASASAGEAGSAGAVPFHGRGAGKGKKAEPCPKCGMMYCKHKGG